VKNTVSITGITCRDGKFMAVLLLFDGQALAGHRARPGIRAYT
jgi:GDP-D-mannose dehydratase